jgi:hypothetical protein
MVNIFVAVLAGIGIFGVGLICGIGVLDKILGVAKKEKQKK